MDAKKITKVICTFQRDLVLKLHVSLMSKVNDRVQHFHNEFTFENDKYIRVDTNQFLTLEIPKTSDGVWAKDKSIMITQKNIHHIRKGMKKMLDSIYGDEIFAVNSKGGIVIFADMVEKHTQKIYNLGMNSRIQLRPAIIIDRDNDTEYEGVILYLNSTRNAIELTIDTFESLYYTLKDIDIFLYAQTLLNYHVMMQHRNQPAEKPKKPNKNITANIFETSTCKSSGAIKKQTPEEFFEMKG